MEIATRRRAPNTPDECSKRTEYTAIFIAEYRQVVNITWVNPPICQQYAGIRWMSSSNNTGLPMRAYALGAMRPWCGRCGESRHCDAAQLASFHGCDQRGSVPCTAKRLAPRPRQDELRTCAYSDAPLLVESGLHACIVANGCRACRSPSVSSSASMPRPGPLT